MFADNVGHDTILCPRYVYGPGCWPIPHAAMTCTLTGFSQHWPSATKRWQCLMRPTRPTDSHVTQTKQVCSIALTPGDALQNPLTLKLTLLTLKLTLLTTDSLPFRPLTLTAYLVGACVPLDCASNLLDIMTCPGPLTHDPTCGLLIYDPLWLLCDHNPRAHWHLTQRLIALGARFISCTAKLQLSWDSDPDGDKALAFDPIASPRPGKLNQCPFGPTHVALTHCMNDRKNEHRH